MSLSQKGLLVVCVPLAFQIILLVALFAIEDAHDRDREAERRSKELGASAHRLMAILADAESGVRGYALTGNPTFTQPYEHATVLLPAELRNLRALAARTEEKSDDIEVAQLEHLIEPVIAFDRKSIEKIGSGHRDETVADLSRQSGRKLMDDLRAGMDRFLAGEQLLEANRDRSALRARNEITIAFLGGALLDIALAVWLAIFFTRSVASRVQVVVSKVARLERNEPLGEPLGGHDEIALLDDRLHQMAAALRAADEQWRQAEENLHRFFTISLDMLSIAGFDGFFRLLNPSWEKVLGHPLRDLYARPFLDFVHPDDREATSAEAQRLSEGGLTVRFENRYRSVDGSYRWLLWNAAGVPDAGVIYAAATDITERKGSEELLAQRNAALEFANRELESFTYSVSHDLRAPLRAIDGYTRIFEEDYANTLDGEGQRLLGVIRSEAQRMGVLIDDLLSFSRVSRQSLHRTEVDLRQMAEEIVSAERRRNPHRQIEFVAGAAPIALADSAAIRQAVFNLINNAVKYSSGRVHIELGGSAKDDHNLYWISDRGIGFDMRYAEKIFGVFQRLHSHAEIEGTGVGLAIVQRIVERHGGRVWAESEIRKGSTFFFTLPVSPQANTMANAIKAAV